MKPFSCDHLAPIKTRQKADPSAVHNEHNERAGPTEWVEIGPTPKLPLEGQLGSPKKGTASPNKKFLDEPMATSLQSFSSGGSSPSWSRKWNSPKGQAIPARTLAGYRPDASSLTLNHCHVSLVISFVTSDSVCNPGIQPSG